MVAPVTAVDTRLRDQVLAVLMFQLGLQFAGTRLRRGTEAVVELASVRASLVTFVVFPELDADF